MTRKDEQFVPIDKNEVTLYTCGPTVYNFAHIGNLRSYCLEDLLKRVLEYDGYKVKHVMNITDVEDKIIRSCTGMGASLHEFTAPYIKAFKEDIASLNIEPATLYPKATENIDEIVKMIQSLAEKNLAYKGEDGSWYFSIERFPEYGQLSGLDNRKLKVGSRVSHDEYDKEHLSDFALWKAWTEKDGDIFWETELGKGRPGWHMECSAMSLKYLGKTIDIHMGGVDNIFPHHENEIAQSQAYTGEKFVNYWVHCEHLLSEGRKMSKSLGNFYTLRDLVQKGYNPLALRYLFISAHYRSKLNFTILGLDGAVNTLKGLYDFMRRLAAVKNENSSFEQFDKLFAALKTEFIEAIYADLNTPTAFAALFSFISKVNIAIDQNSISTQQAKLLLDYLCDIDRILALNLKSALEEELPQEITALIEERTQARKNKDFARSDELRDLLAEKGYIVRDTPKGVVWSKK